MPKATARLISNGRLIHQGLICQQDEDSVVFTFKGSGKKYIEGSYLTPIDTLTFAHGRIVIMDPTLLPGPGPCKHVKSIEKLLDYETWHKCYGHPSNEVFLKILLNVNGWKKVEIPEGKLCCEVCLKGKMKAKPYKLSSK